MITDRPHGNIAEDGRQVLEDRQLLKQFLSNGACDQPLYTTELSTDLDGNELHLLGYFFHGGIKTFDRILAEEKPHYMARPFPSIYYVIDRIHQAGGLAVLAHPDLYGWCSGKSVVANRLLEGLIRLREAGLDGVEAYHGEATLARQAEVAAAGKALGLVLTTGSDTHGANRKEWLVVGALLSQTDEQGQLRYLICRRRSPGRHAGLWELPGGKVESGESIADALSRELEEELAVTAQIGPLLHVLWYDYPGERVILAVL
ncbi:MAG: NUDIX domain-containing protein, partial [Bacillota bacterium]|nr:NUDIX domain-containing protein [Bacillota bacterium]